MAIQEVFKLLLDGKDFGDKIKQLSDQWDKFAKNLTSKEIDFKFNDASLKKLASTLERETANITKFAEKLNKAFPNEIKINAGTAVADIQKELERVLKAAQVKLDQNPLNLLKQVKKDLATLQDNQKFMDEAEVKKSREAAAAKIASVEGFAGKRFTAAFGNADTLGKQIKLLTTRIKELGEGASKTAKDAEGLPKFITSVKAGFDQINKSAGIAKNSKEKLDFFSTLKGFSPQFLASLEQFAKLIAAQDNEDVKIKPDTLKAAKERFEAAAKLDRKRINAAKEAEAATTKIVEDSAEARLQATERNGKVVLESVKRVGLKITEANGDTFRPLGEAVTDFSKAAEDALGRAKDFQTQAASFKVPATNPLSPQNLQKNVTVQENLNKKIAEFLQLQRDIREAEAASADLASKKKAGIELSKDETGKLLDDEDEINRLKVKALNLSAELTTLQKESLAAEKAITAELSKQLRLDADRAKIFKTINEKEVSRAQTVSALTSPVTDLPTGLPKADKVAEDFKKLQDLEQKAADQRVKIRVAADNLLAAQSDSARQAEVSSLQKTLNEELNLLKTFDTQFNRIAGNLPRKIAEASKLASSEFDKIRGASEKDAIEKSKISAEAQDKASQQALVTQGLRQRNANKELISLNEELLRAQESLSVRREQEAVAAQNKLSNIEKAGTLKRIQELGIAPKPAVTVGTDEFADQVKKFEQQLPKFDALIQRKVKLEEAGAQLTLDLAASTSTKEAAIIQQAIIANSTARKQAEEDILKARAGLGEEELKRLTDQTAKAVQIAKDGEKAAAKAKKERLDAEEDAVRKHNQEILSQESKLDTERALLAKEQAEKQKFLLDNAVALSGRADAERVNTAKATAEQLDKIEKARLERIRVIEAEIAQLRAHPPGAGLVAPPPGSPPGTPPSPPPKPVAIAPPQPMTQLFTDLRKLQREQDKANAKGTFFNEILKGFEKNIGQSVGSVIKFQLAWRLAGPLISTALAPIELIGTAIQTGLAHLAEFQTKVVQVREILLQNVRFADDITTNFDLGTLAAEKLAKQMDRASTKVATSSEVFQQVFESFVQSGGLQTVGGDLQKAVDTVALLIQDLGSVGISLRDARRPVSEISKLLTLGVTGRDALPRALKRSSDELAAIVKNAREEGNLFEVISQLSSSQAKSLSLADKSFARLLDKVQLFAKIISGAFSQGLFDSTLSGMQRLIQVIEQNQEEIELFAKTLGSIFGSLSTTLIEIGAILFKIASINPFKGLIEDSKKAESALESLNRQIREGSLGTGKGAIGAVTVGPATVARVASALSEAIDRIVGNIQITNLPEKLIQQLVQQRAGLLGELKQTHVEIIEQSRALEKEGSESLKKQVINSSKPIFEQRELLLSKIKEIDKILAKAPATSKTGMSEFLNRTVGRPVQDAQRALPEEAKKLSQLIGKAFDAGLADAQVDIKRRLELIESDLQLFLEGIASNEARFRELTDLRFTAGQFNELGKTRELLDSIQREQDQKLEEIREERKRKFGNVDDIEAFNDQLERSNIEVTKLGDTIAALKQRRIENSIVTSKVTKDEKELVEQQLANAEEGLKQEKKRVDELEKLRRTFPGLNEPRDEAAKKANASAKAELEVVRATDIAKRKAQQDLNLLLRADREAAFKDDLDATKEALKQAEALFAESNKVRLVDESETIEKITDLRLDAIKTEIADLQRESQTAAANSIPRQRQIFTQIAKLSREAARTAQLSELQLSVAIQKKLAFEKGFQDKRIEFQKEADSEVLQLQVQNGNALESALIDAQEALILRRHVNAQEALDRDIEIAKTSQKILTGDITGFDKSGEFERRQQELDDNFTKDLILNSKNRIIQLRVEAEALQSIAVERLKIEQSGFEQLIAIQEQGTLSNDQLLTNQLNLSKSAHLVADAELRLAETQLKRFQEEQSLLDINKRNIAALGDRENAVESLRQAELRAAIAQRIAESRKTAGVGKRALEDVTGLDLTAVDAARDILTDRINTINTKLEGLKLGDPAIAPLKKELAQLTAAFEQLRESGLAKFGKGVLSVVNQLQNAVAAVIQGFQQGGIGGAVGAGLSQVGSIFKKALGSFGPIVEAAGAVVSVIAAAFTAAARRLAEKIKKAFDKTLEQFHDQTITLGKTIGELERQRVEAIQRLSGKKGGKKELQELLPGFDSAIKDLVQQQKEIQDSFEDELGSLRLGNDALRDFSKSWSDVNDKVQQYIDSFKEGEFTLEKQQNAVEFLSRSLGQLREDLLDSLGESEKEAIQNALDLNDLFEERKKLIEEMTKAQEDFNKAQFDLLTEDAIEKRVAGVVERGSKLVQLRKDFEDSQAERKARLQDIAREIAAKTRIFLQEQQIFNLTLDRTTLLDRQNALDEASLDRQIQKWKDIQAIIDGIQRNPDGTFSISPALQGQISPRITNVTVGAPQIHIDINTGGAPITPNQVTDPLNTFFADRARFGFNNS